MPHEDTHVAHMDDRAEMHVLAVAVWSVSDTVRDCVSRARGRQASMGIEEVTRRVAAQLPATPSPELGFGCKQISWAQIEFCDTSCCRCLGFGGPCPSDL